MQLGNCRVKEECPMDGKCQTMDAVYGRRVTSPVLQKICFGLVQVTATRFGKFLLLVKI